MSSVIKLLPESVVNLISAGEVVEDASCIVKELIENSVDAGATRIQVRVVGSGRELIHIVDNGRGMSPEDAQLAFERHATSKLSSVEDFDKLMTKGFRGEALNAISTVAFVEMRTRQKGAELGTEVIIHGGKTQSVKSCVCPEGTSFIIKDIFFNMTVRRQQLNETKLRTEYKNVQKEFDRVALVHPEIAMSLHHDKTLYKDLLSSNFKERIIALASKRIKGDLLPITSNLPNLKIHGFIGKPESAVKTRAKQFLFVNKRYFDHAGFKNAIIQTFRPYLIADDPSLEPHYFIYFEVPANTLDVNITPRKTRINFYEEEMVEVLLRNLIRSVLGANAVMPVIDFERKPVIDIPSNVQTSKEDDDRMIDFEDFEDEDEPEEDSHVRRTVFMSRRIQVGNKVTATQNFSAKDKVEPQARSMSFRNRMKSASPSSLKKTRLNFINSSQENEEIFPTIFSKEASVLDGLELNDLSLDTKASSGSQTYFFFKGKYLITSTLTKILMIHKQRAYERILFDRYMREIGSSKLAIQPLMFPEILHLDDGEQEVFNSIMEDLKGFGFNFKQETEDTYLITEVPALMEGNEVQILKSVMSECLEHNESRGYDILMKTLALDASTKNASSLANQLKNEDIDAFMAELFSCSEANITPQGETILIAFDEEQMESWF